MPSPDGTAVWVKLDRTSIVGRILCRLGRHFWAMDIPPELLLDGQRYVNGCIRPGCDEVWRPPWAG